MKITPLFDNVVLSLIEQEEKTSSGILLPNTNDKPSLGKVISVGNGINQNGEEIKMQVKVNDIVLFNKFAQTQIKLDNKDYILIKQTEILAKLN